MYIGTTNGFFDLDDVKFIIIKDCSTGIGFATLNQSYSFDITEESFDKFLKENNVNFIKLVQKVKFLILKPFSM